MNSFCNNLNLSITPLRPEIDINNLPEVYWNTISIADVNPKLIVYLYLRGISITKVSIFFAKGPTVGTIHLDGTTIADEVKISWTYGDDHSMHWYTTNVTHTHSINNTINVKRYYIEYEPHEVTLIYSQKVGFPSITQVGIPHNVTTYSGVRRNITMLLINNHTHQPLTMNEALTMLSDIIA